MKQAIVLFIILIPIWLFCQDVPFAVKSKTRYSSSGLVGNVKIDSVKYLQLRFIQEFELWKISMGLDLEFLLDKDYHLRPDNWDHLRDILSKIYYIKFGTKKDLYYAHLGGFPSLSLGYGLIMQNYSNMLLYPNLRNTGLMVGFNPVWPTNPSFEIFTSNIEKNQIMSLTARCKPLPDSTIRIMEDLEIGFSIVTDLNQYGNLKYIVNDSLYHIVDDLKSKSATIYGFGYNIPIIKTDKITVGNYAEIAHINDYGTGFILPGIYSDFNFLIVSFEYRIYGDKFTPSFFNKYYEEDRAIVVGDSIIRIVTKEELLKNQKEMQGWYGSIQGFIGRKVKAKFAWQNTFGDELKTGKSIWFDVWVDSQYKRLENFAISYSKIGTESMAIHRLNQPKAEISAEATIRVTKKRLFAIGQYAERYKDKNGDGKVNWAKETKRAWSIGVKYLF